MKIHCRILKKENLKNSRLFFPPLKFLFVESEIHCFSPYFRCTLSAMGLESLHRKIFKFKQNHNIHIT